MPRALVDAQLPPALARFLSANGLAADHVMDLGWDAKPDTEIWRDAKGVYDVLISKDEDFVTLAQLRGPGPCVVWIRKGNCTRAALLSWFAPLMPVILERIAAGEPIIEVI